MHEMSVIENVVREVEKQLRPHAPAQLQSVTVRVGQLRQLEPAMLQFCFEAAVIGTPFEGAQLVVHRVPATARCAKCSTDFPVEEAWFECPECHSTGATLLTGNELKLLEIEVRAVCPDRMSAAEAGVDSVS